MKNQSYYRLAGDDSCNIAVLDRFLTVNCTGVCVLPDPFSNANPSGRRDFYLMYLYSGELEAAAAGQQYTLREGDLLVYPAGKPYRYRKKDSDEMIYFWAHFSGYGAEELLRESGIEPGRVFHPGKSEELAACFERLFEPFFLRKKFFEMEAAAQLIMILSKAARRILRRTEEQSAPPAVRIRRSLEYLYRNYAEPVRLEQLAQLEHLSPSRYSAVFRQCMGMSPQHFLISLRIRNAADLMRRTDLSVKQIAQAVGYDDPFYFSSLFKQKTSFSPSAYQQKCRITTDIKQLDAGSNVFGGREKASPRPDR